MTKNTTHKDSIQDKLDLLLSIVPENTQKAVMEAFILGTHSSEKIHYLCGCCDGKHRYEDDYDCPSCVDGFGGI